MTIKMAKPGVFSTNPMRGHAVPHWETVREFCEWWNAANRPIAPPDEVVNLSDDATSFCLFRSGQFQVELYLIHPCPNLPIHGHPDVDVIKMRLDTWAVDDAGQLKQTTYREASETLVTGETHGAGVNFKGVARDVVNGGFGLLAFQKWKDGLTPTTVAARWKGPTVGPMQEDLIRRLTPGATVMDGYADTTGAS
jgi:hypothetical protein